MANTRRKTKTTRRKVKRKKRQKTEAPGWQWMLFGLGLGLAVAVVVYVTGTHSQRTPKAGQVQTAVEPNQQPSASPATSAASQTAGNQHTSASSTSRSPGAPQDKEPKASDKTEFDFYKILPKYQVKVPTYDIESNRIPPAPVETSGEYVIQVASLRDYADADRLKASLALIGIESNIQQVRVDGTKYNRVRIGPLKNLDKINRIRTKLYKKDINPLLIRVDE